MAEKTLASGPDFSLGIALADIPENGTIAGRVGEEPILLSRLDGELFAVAGSCTHYGARLGDGIEGETVRCRLHHACFNLKTGAALRAPALDGLQRWRVDVRGTKAFVSAKLEDVPEARRPATPSPSNVAIIGGGAAGLACAHELRRLGYRGSVTMFSADGDKPYDRPNLSKDYLAGTAAEEWLPLRGDSWYSDQAVDVRTGVEITRIDPLGRTIRSAGGEEFGFDRLLIATGSEPNRLMLSGFDGDRVFQLRSVEDARAIIEVAKPGARAVIIGSSFIGLEAAAALRTRNVEVAIVSPEHVPFERLFGAELGTFLQRLHEQNGVRFHLGAVAAKFDGQAVFLADGQTVEADFVLVGIGAKPRTGLAEAAGLGESGGILVNRFLETSAEGIYAAGDIASYPDPLTGEKVRIEHWVHAQRQGQTAAANMLGLKQPFESVPFFWTEQYGVAVRYVGHAADWDEVAVDGDMSGGKFLIRYLVNGIHRATASVGRDLENLADERRFESTIREVREKAPSFREPTPDFAIQ